MGRIYLYSERLLNSKLTCLTCLEKLNFLFLHLKTTVYRLQSCDQMRGAARFLVQSATKTKQIKPVNGLASMATPSSKFWLKLELYSPFPECLTFSSHVCSLKNHTGMMTITTPQRHGNENTCILEACSAGLKNTVPADCCERKILFWQDVNSDFVKWLASQPASHQLAEHCLSFWKHQTKHARRV